MPSFDKMHAEKMNASTTMNWQPRLKAAGIHLCISAAIAVLSAIFVFSLWYPWPYRIVSGGQSLFFIVLSVDLILGPLLTLVVFNITKTRSHLVRDLSTIGLLQLCGLAYGFYTVFLARPVVVAFEVDQFRVVSYTDVMHKELPLAKPEFRTLSISGPRIVSARRPVETKDKTEALLKALGGHDIGTRPIYWEPYEMQKEAILKRTSPLNRMYEHYPGQTAELDRILRDIGKSADELRFAPLLARNPHWSVLIDGKTAEVVGYVPYDGYF